ncbi:hypothetical protein ACLB2K_033964 [Fragaria x ananassa]
MSRCLPYTPSGNRKASTCDNGGDVLHQSLIVNWVQPLLHLVVDDYGDQDWLFETKRENSHCSKRFKANNQLGLSALPFTVPF